MIERVFWRQSIKYTTNVLKITVKTLYSRVFESRFFREKRYYIGSLSKKLRQILCFSQGHEFWP